MTNEKIYKIAVVIPCYKVNAHILNVIQKIGPTVCKIYVVDDACPTQSGKLVLNNCRDTRVEVLYNDHNMGVGGAVKVGYKKALQDEMDIVVKIDGDGQMNTELIPNFIKPIITNQADYVKGNRFFDITFLQKMPKLRLLGNASLSFVSKLTSGYWDIMDPTNGFTAIHTNILAKLPMDKIENRFFFESDMLYQLALVRAVVVDLPMVALYGHEKSSLKISQVLWDFPPKYFIRFLKRIFYIYYLRDFNIASFEFLIGVPLFLFGFVFCLSKWIYAVREGIPTSAGTVMLGALTVILGFQLILSAINFDLQNIPHRVLHEL